MKAYKFNFCRKLMKAVFWIAFCGGSSFAYQVLADGMTNISDHRFDNWERASDSELDQLRGGFVLPNGMTVDFSLARLTTINGAVVSSSFFQLPGNGSLVQNGALMHQFPNMAAGTGLNSVIQNNLDNQVIKSVTDINLAVSHLKNLGVNNNGMFFNNYIAPNTH